MVRTGLNIWVIGVVQCLILSLVLGCGDGEDNNEGNDAGSDGSSDGDSGPRRPGSGKTGTIDCEWMESDNCWKQVLSEVAACVPQIGGDAGSTTGVFNGDRTSCTYTGGPLIDFDDPVLLPFDPDNIAFDVTQNEETCLRFEKTFIVGVSETIKIEVASGTLYSRSESGDCDSCISQTIECPDGSSFNTGNAIKTYMDCDSNPSNWPIGIVEQSGATTVGLDMSGGEEGQVSLFHCEFSL